MGAARHKTGKNEEGTPPKKRELKEFKCAAEEKENGLKDKEEKTKSRRERHLHYGSIPIYSPQQPQPNILRSLHRNNRPVMSQAPSGRLNYRRKTSGGCGKRWLQLARP
jgi:hypothetical protein